MVVKNCMKIEMQYFYFIGSLNNNKNLLKIFDIYDKSFQQRITCINMIKILNLTYNKICAIIIIASKK